MTESVARCDEDEIDKLRRTLKLEHPDDTVRGGGDTAAAPLKADVKREREDILNVVSRGVRIASSVESLPLIPLIEASGVQLPPALKVDKDSGYDFYHVQIVFSILLEPKEFASRAEFALDIDGHIPSERRARALQLFPGYKSQDYFSAKVQGAVGVDAKLEFDIALPEGVPQAKAEAGASASAKASLLLGPHEFSFRKAAIEVRGVGDSRIEWRYNLDDTLEGTNDFKSFLILKVPSDAERITLRANLGIQPSKTSWLFFKSQLPVLRDAADLHVELRPKTRA